MKKTLIILIVLFLITGCGKNKDEEKEKNEILICETAKEKYVFRFDDNDVVNSIYYEDNFIFDQYYTDFEIEEFKNNPIRLMQIIDNNLIDCNQKEYACNSLYDNFVISNRYYIDTKEKPSLVGLDNYYGLNKQDVRTRVIASVNDSICKLEDDSDLYVVNDKKTTIILDKTYNSIDDMHKDLTKEKYYKKYTLVDINDKIGSIEFMENGKCIIDLSGFNENISSNTYCEPNHKNYTKIIYNNGNCTYKVYDHKFEIKYDGTYSTGRYCETHEDSINYETKKVIPYELIELEFDDNYNSFTITNGSWQKSSVIAPIIFK